MAALKKVRIARKDAIKGKSYEAGEVAEFEENVALAIVHQKRGEIVDDATPLGAPPAPPAETKPASAKKAK